MPKQVLGIITTDQLRELREAGFIVVHREPTKDMIGSAVREGEYMYGSPKDVYHRMVGTSIRIQNEETK